MKSLKSLDLMEIMRRTEAESLRRQANVLTMPSQQAVNYQCVKCQDEEGYVARNVTGYEGYEVWRDCECVASKRVGRLIQASQITPEFRRHTFATFDTSEVCAPVQDAYHTACEYTQMFSDMRKSRRNSIALLGRAGSGKTHLLMAVANTLLERGVGVLYFPWVEGFNALKDDFTELETKIRQLQTTEVLYIDDAFKGRREPTDFQLEQLFAVVNHRYLAHLPMLISSERSFNDICQMDEAIGSRLWEMCKGYTVTITGASHINYRLR